ncbi:DUF6302 family protein [Streptomyces olivaceus]|uniref:DUF6302 family protein n=1 Tax=Streptomyces olivaceus TaxID=47716 RepID=UPI0036E939B1
MLTTSAKLPHHPTVTLRPAAEAYDYEFFRSRLAEPSLLVDAVAVCVFRAPLLAVPVGGPRRGGYMSFDLLTLATATRILLAERPGFPDLRIRWSPYRDTCHTVEWGDPAPDRRDDAVLGRFYGYSDAAIARFTQRHHQTPSSALFDRSPTAPQLAEEGPPSERTSAMCAHNPPCPTAQAPDGEAARPRTAWAGGLK